MKTCGICGVELDQPGIPDTTNCGGDCLHCMAEVAEDPDAVGALLRLKHDIEE